MQFDREIEKILESFLIAQDHRVRANAIEALGLYRFQNHPLSEVEVRTHRETANLLLIEARLGLSKTLLRRIECLLSKKEPFPVSSGLWLIGEIVDFHRKRDPIYFETNPQLKHLVERASHFVTDSRDVVRRRARKTQFKINSIGLAA